MNPYFHGVRRIFLSDWFLALVLLSVFFLTTAYIYGWDDQHVEIPLLKSLIDPGLYAGDYYVESLKKNFTSFFYPLLARLITVEQIPQTYFFLYVVCRYFLFFWIYKMWRLIAQERFTAFLCALSVILLFHIEDFLYRTFSHQEFALPVIFAGFYFFYKERYLIAAAIFGAAANFHALYSFFPFLYMLVYLLWRQTPWKKTLAVAAAGGLAALPVVVWTVIRRLQMEGNAAPPAEEWLKLYYLASPQNFIFSWTRLKELADPAAFLQAMEPYLFPAVLFVLNALFLPRFLKARKTLAVILTGWALLVVSFIFTYLFPSRFIIDLNLVRNNQFIYFFITGYFIILLVKLLREKPFFVSALIAAPLPLLRFGNNISVLAGLALIFFLGAETLWNKGKKRSAVVGATASAACFAAALIIFFRLGYTFTAQLVLYAYYASIAAIIINYFFLRRRDLSFLFLAALIFVSAMHWMYFHYQQLTLQREGRGFWRLQNAWIDMQNFVRENTPKDALILVPHDMEMGGFRIRSEREIVCSYRDCGIIGFDYSAAVEWKNRMEQIGAFRVRADSRQRAWAAALFAIRNYKVNYIVFVKNADPRPGTDALLKKIYENNIFVLYEVRVNPVEQN